MGSWFEPIATIFMGLILVAIVAELVGQHSQTAGVVSSVFGGFGQDITAAEGPVLGN